MNVSVIAPLPTNLARDMVSKAKEMVKVTKDPAFIAKALNNLVAVRKKDAPNTKIDGIRIVTKDNQVLIQIADKDTVLISD